MEPSRQVRLPFEFAENKGQWDASISFRAQQSALDVQVGRNFISYYFYDPEAFRIPHTHSPEGSLRIPPPLKVHGLRFSYQNTDGGLPVLPHPLPWHLNFYQGNDHGHWAGEVKVGNEVAVSSLYEGIDLWLKYEDGELKSEYHLDAGTSPSKIQMKVEGADKLSIEYGDLIIMAGKQRLRERRPFAWQYRNGIRTEVSIAFTLTGSVVGFSTGEGYDPSLPLVIDPEIVFLTYSGSEVDNFGCTATPGRKGEFFAAGVSTGPYTVNPTGKYPVTAGAFQMTYAGGGIAEGEGLGQFPSDITISKYRPDGKMLLFATYLGGSNNEVPHSMYVDDSSNLVVLGNTYSGDFPVTRYAYDTSHNGRHDFIVTKFKSNGIIYASTYLGGSGNDAINFNGVTNYFFADSYRGDVITDSTGSVFAASVTQSNNFPVSALAPQKTLKGAQDGVVFKLSPDLSKLLWSTYLGGDGIDALYSIDIGQNRQIYLSGGTSSGSLPNTSAHFQPTNAGGQTDGMILILDYNGQNILHSTYFGTDGYDQIFSLDIDGDNRIYVVGQSTGSIPVTPGRYAKPGSHQFLACFSPDLKSKIWSTVFGSGRPNIDVTINAFLVDDCKRIYISSWGGSSSSRAGSSTSGMDVSPDAFQAVTDGSDFYLMLLNKDASDLLYATYVGGDDPENEGDHVDGGTSRFDKQGVVYQSLCASCPPAIRTVPLSDLKTTAGSFSPLNKSPRCSNAALKFDFSINTADFSWEADTCASVFQFYNKTANASRFLWTFPDGDTSMLENPKRMIPSKYYGDSVRLIVEFGSVCADTAYRTISLPDSLDQLNIANVFTPNGDGINDFFMLKGVSGQCNKTEVYIYNRWGQLYYQNDVSYFRWDGTDGKGNEAPEGVYFYLLKSEKLSIAEVHELHGTITLMR